MRLLSLFSRRCRTNSEPKDLPAAGSQITSAIATSAACGLVFASMGFGALFAWHSTIGHGPLMAGLTVLFAIALEACKPLAVASAFSAFRSWAMVRGVALAALATVAIAYSLTAELSLIAGSRGDLLAKREATIESHDDRRQRVKDARGELATLAASRTIEEASADITRLLAANPRAGDCRNAAVNATARRVCPKVADYHGEIARAKKRAELQAIIDRHVGDKSTTAAVKHADPGSAALATYLGTLGVGISADRLTDWLVLIPVLALEIGAALSVLLVQSVSGSGSRQITASGKQPDTQAIPVPTQAPDAQSRITPGSATPEPNEPRTPRKPIKRTRDKGGKGGGGGRSGKRRLGNVVDLLRARGGQITGGQRAIARALRMSKSRVNEILHTLAAAGTVRLTTSHSGTTVALAA